MVSKQAPWTDGPPRLDGAVVVRHRLLARLAESLHYGVSLVVAPAGYGKTTLLAQFAEQGELPVAWVQLTSRDQDGVHLAQRIANAVAQAVGMKRSPTVVPDHLPGWLEDSRSDAFQLVLEDLHELDSRSSGFSLIEKLVASKPHTYSLLLSSRSEPASKVFSRAKTSKQLIITRPADLLFDPLEIGDLAVALNVSNEVDVTSIRRTSGGWPIAVVAQLSEGHDSRHGQLLDFFISQVYQAMPYELQKFASLASNLVPLTAAVADAAIGVRNSGVRLSALEAKGYLVTSIGEGSERLFAMHPLFADFLRGEAQERWPAELSYLHVKAAGYYKSHHHWLPAAEHWRRLGAWTALVRLITYAAPRLRSAGEHETILALIDALPPEHAARKPEIVLWRARALHALGKYDEALAALADVFGSKASSAVNIEATTLRGALLLHKGRIDAAAQVIDGAFEMLEGSGSEASPILADAYLRRATLKMRRNAYPEAEQDFQRALSIYEQRGMQQDAANVLEMLGVTKSQQSAFPEAAVYVEAALKDARRRGDAATEARILNSLGIARYRLGSPVAAAQCFTQAAELAETCGARGTYAHSITNLARVTLFAGRFEEALQLFSQAREIVLQLGDAVAACLLLGAIGNAYRRLGRFGEAKQALSQAVADAQLRGERREAAQYRVWDAAISIAEGLYARAEDNLKDVQRTYTELNVRGEPAASVLYLLAHIRFRQRKRTECLQLLAQIAKQMADENIDNIVDEALKEFPEAANYAIARGQDVELWREIQARIGRTNDPENAEMPKLPTMVHSLCAEFLGQIRISLDGRQLHPLEWRSTSAVELLLYFMVNPRPARLYDVALALWPDADRTQAYGRFHSNLYRLRRALSRDVIVESGGRYSLGSNYRTQADVMDFRKLYARARVAEPAMKPALLRQAARAYKDELAAEFFSEWSNKQREDLQAKYLRVLVKLGDLEAAAGHGSEAARLYREACRIDDRAPGLRKRLSSLVLAS